MKFYFAFLSSFFDKIMYTDPISCVSKVVPTNETTIENTGFRFRKTKLTHKTMKKFMIKKMKTNI